MEKDLLDKYGSYSHMALPLLNNISSVQRTSANRGLGVSNKIMWHPMRPLLDIPII